MKKKVELIHKEKNEECFEILKCSIVEDKELKKYRIDKDTLLHELPEDIVNNFLDFLGSDEHHRNSLLRMIKNGSVVVHCWEDEDKSEADVNFTSNSKNKDRLLNRKQKQEDSTNYPLDLELPF